MEGAKNLVDRKKAASSIKTEVYNSLKSDLLIGQLPPGAFLQEQQLAERFGVSKTPIREALASLVDQRLITLLPRKGYLVAPIDMRETVENIELRIILECAAVELAAVRITEDQIAELEALILPHASDGRELVDRAMVAAYGRNNILFHTKIGEASGNQTLARALQVVLENLTRAIFVSYSFPKLGETADDHRSIVDMLRQHNVEGARAAIERHLEITRQRLMNTVVGGLNDTGADTVEPRGKA